MHAEQMTVDSALIEDTNWFLLTTVLQVRKANRIKDLPTPPLRQR